MLEVPPASTTFANVGARERDLTAPKMPPLGNRAVERLLAIGQQKHDYMLTYS
jgi:hypothetical protein